MPTVSALRRFGSATGTPSVARGTAAFATLLLIGVLPAAARTGDRYGYYRLVEGNATLVQQGESLGAQENQPVVSGDRIWTGRGSRVEAVLADGTLLRVAGDSEVVFEELAQSDDGSADANYLTLRRGEVQLVASGVSDTRVDTDNATVYVRDAGNYRLETRDETTLLVVRNGRAEVRTRRGAVSLDGGEEAWIEGDGSPEVESAGSWDTLERWASALDDEYRRGRYDDDGIDASLGYSASRMGSYGSWVTVSNRRAWRPRVGADWSPYRNGRWGYTPSGLTWISYEPWGWVPYHYGTWDYTPGWGWAWYPGRVYAPAWVYWYWGPSHVGWCPIGYYSHYYGPRFYSGWGFGIDFTWGFGRRVHGWAGGSSRHFNHWNFVDCHNLYDRRLAYHTRSSAQLGGQLARGVISTETRGLKPALATRPSEGMRILANGGAGFEKPIRPLQDISSFVARDPNVGADLGRVAMPVDRDGNGRGVGGGNWTRPGEKPAVIGDGGGASGRGASEAIGKPGEAIGKPGEAIGKPGEAIGRPGDWRGGAGGGRVDGGQTGNGRSRTGVGVGTDGGQGGNGRRAVPDSGWRTSPGAGADGGKPSGEQRPTTRTRPGDGTGTAPGSRARPNDANGNDGGKPDGSGAAGARPRGGDDNWRGDSGQQRVPRSDVRSTRPEEKPNGAALDRQRSDDEGWRGGRESTGASRPPVRRIVEGVRSNRQEPQEPSLRQGDVRRPESSGASSQPSWRSSRPEPDRREPASVREPQRPSREAVRERPDSGASRGAVERGSHDRGSSSGHDHGSSGGSHDRGDSGSRGDSGGSHGSRGAETRPSHDSDGGDPNR
jgi:hypothetical protein